MIRNVQAPRKYGISFEVADNAGTSSCYVTLSALQDRAARDKMPTTDLLAIFNSYRSEIESAIWTKRQMGNGKDPIIINHLPNN